MKRNALVAVLMAIFMPPALADIPLHDWNVDAELASQAESFANDCAIQMVNHVPSEAGQLRYDALAACRTTCNDAADLIQRADNLSLARSIFNVCQVMSHSVPQEVVATDDL